MRLILKLIPILIISATINSCGLLKNNKKYKPKNNEKSNKQLAVIQNEDKKTTPFKGAELYIKTYSSVAKSEMNKYGIPASITLAQGLLESGMGIGYLAKNANNHFGIKCHKNWEGDRIYYDDDEKGECFRVYTNSLESYYDHSIFLNNRSRYKFLFELNSNDYKGWAKGLKKAGYATDPKYSTKLINLIERYNLSRFDKSNFKRASSNKYEKKKYRLIIHQVEKGDTLFSISRKYNVDIKDLIDQNNIINKTIYIGQNINVKVRD
jgi:flagellum-specific peptidoglycan hydrolase FlgJ